MKPTVDYKLKKESRWLTASAAVMGIAFFLQAFDFLGLRLMQGVGLLDTVVYMILPMLAEAVWCVYVRTGREHTAKTGGIIGAVLCAVVLLQTLFCGSVLLILIGCASCLLAGAALVLITWGFFPHRRLGMLVFAAVAAIRVLLFDVIGLAAGRNWSGLLSALPAVCILLSLMLFFGGIFPMRKK